MDKWVLATKKADFTEMANKFHIDQVTARILRNRDIVDEDEIESFLNGTLKDLGNPCLFKDGDQLIQLLSEGIRAGKKIRILGDYDIDGVTSTFILYQAISRCQGRVDTVIPDRITDGYGLNEHLVTKAKEEGVEILITCDNGIAAIDAIAIGKDLGMTILVTDHHEIPYVQENGEVRFLVSRADAIVNPKQQECRYPYKQLCGAGVVYLLTKLLYQEFQVPIEEWEALSVYSAIGTIGDVVDLTGDNRIMVKEGLHRLNSCPPPALAALIQACGLGGKTITSYHIGFVIGPCINASGRLETAELALELLKQKNESDAGRLAERLVELNETRKQLTEKYVDQAEEQIREMGDGEMDPVLFLYLPDCHESIAGIIAGRIREAHHHPVFVATRTQDGYLKGSGRSIEAYSMFQKMNEVADLFLKFGGHPMAAGFSLEEKNLQKLIQELNERANLVEEDFIPKVMIDVPMPLSYLNEGLIQEFSRLEPFGKGNPKPVFAQKEVSLLSIQLVGSERKFAKCLLCDQAGRPITGISFGDPYELKAFLEEKYEKGVWEKLLKGNVTDIQLSILYYPEINTFRDQKKVQVIIQGYC